MKADSLTCKQSVTIVFDFYHFPNQPADESVLKNRHHRSHNPDPAAIRALASALSERLEHIARMIEVLQSVDDHWAVTGRKDRIILETDSFDFQSVRNVLEERGFQACDYQLFVSYERKWGML
jgi:hypothetical protein